jgi:subtilase family serine protease
MADKRFFAGLLLGIGMLGANSAFGAAPAVSGLTISHNTPKFTASAKSLGTVDPSTVIEVSIWLKPHNKADLDALAKDLYDRNSAGYRHWLTKQELVSRFAPTAAESKTVQDFFTSHNLKIVNVGPDNFYVRARGTVGDVNSAFHVTLNNYSVNGKTIRANPTDPYITGEAAPLVGSVAGLDTSEYTHPLVTRNSNLKLPATPPGVEAARADAAPAVAASLPFNSQCFDGTSTQKFTTEGSLPTATYNGNLYTTANSGCGYTPYNLWKAYGLYSLYAEGYTGKGQTIVILDWCGSPTITSDANAFSAQFGLPQLTDKNFKIINTAPSYCAAPDAEINIDVEWAHAIAPGAAIDLVVPPSASFQDIDEGLFYAVDYQLGNVMSGSYGSEEAYTSESVLETEDLIAETGAVLGISLNFSSGDDGDFTFDEPQYYPASVSAPADSPYATAIGGTSLVINSSNEIVWQTGWGTNQNLVAIEGSVEDPPAGNGYFDFGSGGGPSGFYEKPSYQSALSGSTRQVPDISWLADPYTGAYIAISEPFTTPELTYQVYGGTSLACPMFSALWAIANQEAGEPLGQAAPYLYSMPASTITDIVPVGSSTNVTGKVVDSAGTTMYSAASLVAPLEGTSTYVSAIWDYPTYDATAFLLTFGTDSGLAITKGYDNVTGLGVPNAKAFADWFKQ